MRNNNPINLEAFGTRTNRSAQVDPGLGRCGDSRHSASVAPRTATFAASAAQMTTAGGTGFKAVAYNQHQLSSG